jgi:hypothetical protein
MLRRDWFYILEQHQPMPIGSLWDTEAAVRWAENPGHRDGSWVVAAAAGDGWELSTVFVGLDLSHGCGLLPLPFETVLFLGDNNVTTECEILSRYPSWKAAAAGHVSALAELDKP